MIRGRHQPFYARAATSIRSLERYPVLHALYFRQIARPKLLVALAASATPPVHRPQESLQRSIGGPVVIPGWSMAGTASSFFSFVGFRRLSPPTHQPQPHFPPRQPPRLFVTPAWTPTLSDLRPVTVRADRPARQLHSNAIREHTAVVAPNGSRHRTRLQVMSPLPNIAPPVAAGNSIVSARKAGGSNHLLMCLLFKLQLTITITESSLAWRSCPANGVDFPAPPIAEIDGRKVD